MVLAADPTECFFSVAIDCEVKDVKGHLKKYEEVGFWLFSKYQFADNNLDFEHFIFLDLAWLKKKKK